MTELWSAAGQLNTDDGAVDHSDDDIVEEECGYSPAHVKKEGKTNNVTQQSNNNRAISWR